MKRRIPLIATVLALVMLMSACAMPGINFKNLQEGKQSPKQIHKYLIIASPIFFKQEEIYIYQYTSQSQMKKSID